MCNRKRLYDHAKRTNTTTDWDAYRKARNLVNNKLEAAHCDYQRRLFDESFSGNQRQFWKYIKSMKRDSTGIPTLLSNGKEFNTAKGKASVLNDHFQSVYTSKDLIFQTLAAVFLLYHQ